MGNGYSGFMMTFYPKLPWAEMAKGKMGLRISERFYGFSSNSHFLCRF